jgi:TonB-dependent receptor
MSLNHHKKNRLTTAISMAIFSCGMLSGNIALAQEAEESAAKGKQADESIEVIEVTGSIRASYLGSIGAKRVADTVVEVLSAEDIGQFLDDSIAGALQRMPGIQIEVDESGAGGDRVSIRGLGPQFVNSSINGRTLLSSGNEGAGLRSMNFNVFPSSILSGVRVAKGQTASKPESGLAGQVDLQTLRPLEISKLENKQTFSTLSYKRSYKELGGKSGDSLDGVFAWRNEANDLAFYVGAVISETDSESHQVSESKVVRNINIDTTGDGLIDDTIIGVTVPNAHTARPIIATAERKAFSSGIQWQPTEDINVVYDATFARFDNETVRNNGQIIFNPLWGANVIAAGALDIDEDNVLRSLNLSQSNGLGAVLSRVHEQKYSNYTDNFINGLNVDWVKGNLTTNFDVYYSDLSYSQDLRFPIFNKNLDILDIKYENYGTTPSITTGADIVDSSSYAYLFSAIREIYVEGDNHGSTLSFNYALDNNWSSSVDFGVHYEKTDVEVRRSIYPDQWGRDLSVEEQAQILAVGLSGNVIDSGFLEGVGHSPNTWLTADYDAMGEVDPRLLTTGLEQLGTDPDSSHDSIEEQLAVFGQINIETEINEMLLTGNIGLRAVKTTNESTALTVTSGIEEEPIYRTTNHDYWEYLPSVNLNLSINDKSALRFGASKTISRPELQDMAPIINVNIPTACVPDEAAEVTCNGTIRAGNTELKPMTSVNLDITYEYYNDYDGAAVVSLFHKNVSDFIINDTLYDVSFSNVPTDRLYDLTTPINFSDGEAKGFEIGFHQPFDKLVPMLKGFGLAANYTKVKSSFDEDVGDSGFGFPGSSENNYNFSAYYEKEGFGIRVAYVYRDDFFRSLAGQGTQTSDARFTSASEDLSANIRYRFNKHLLVMLNGTNLLDKGRRDYIGIESKYLDYFYRGRTTDLSVRYDF